MLEQHVAVGTLRGQGEGGTEAKLLVVKEASAFSFMEDSFWMGYGGWGEVSDFQGTL